jgi:archaellum component FlaC
VSAEIQERMLNGKDNVVLGFILDYLTSLGSKVDKLKDQFHEFDKTQSPIRDELADLKKNGDLRQHDTDILKKQQESKIAI